MISKFIFLTYFKIRKYQELKKWHKRRFIVSSYKLVRNTIASRTINLDVTSFGIDLPDLENIYCLKKNTIASRTVTVDVTSFGIDLPDLENIYCFKKYYNIKNNNSGCNFIWD